MFRMLYTDDKDVDYFGIYNTNKSFSGLIGIHYFIGGD